MLFNLNANITILYTEGIIYHPTPEEYELSKNGNLNNLSQTEGVDKVFISPEYNGGSKEQQDFIICFPSFKAERTQSIITYIDDLILKQNDKKRLVWIIGIPHMEEPLRTQRKDIQIKINNLTENDKIYNVDTLNYKNTIQALEHIYNDANNKYHINISDLGSKMQSFGIALFANLRRDVTVYYSEPKKYNPFHYSEGIKTFWMIEIGNTKEFVKTFFKVGNVEIRNNS